MGQDFLELPIVDTGLDMNIDSAMISPFNFEVDDIADSTSLSSPLSLDSIDDAIPSSISIAPNNDLFKMFLNEDELSFSSSEDCTSSPESMFTDITPPPSSPVSGSICGSPSLSQSPTRIENLPILSTGSSMYKTMPKLKEEPHSPTMTLPLSLETPTMPITMTVPTTSLITPKIAPISSPSKKRDRSHTSPTAGAISLSPQAHQSKDQSPLALSRDELLKLSTKSVEALPANTVRSTDDERHIKRQRRLIKNRESAQLS